MGATGFYLRVGDATTCGGKIQTGDETLSWYGVAGAREGDAVTCGEHPGNYKILGGTSDAWDEGRMLAGTLDSVSSCPCEARFISSIPDGYSKDNTQEEQAEAAHLLTFATQQTEPKPKQAEEKPPVEAREHNRVFAKSCLRGDGCNDAGEVPEPHNNFADMCFFQALPPVAEKDDSDVPQYAQAAKKNKPVAPEEIPKPKKRSALYTWWHGNHEEMAHQAAVAAAASAARAQTATAGASVLEPLAGRTLTYGTWAVRGAASLGNIAAAGAGAPLTGLLIGMFPGKLNDGEQDFIDRMRLAQRQEAPTRVRYTWEHDNNGNPLPRGWHTPPGKDSVRVRNMAWDNDHQAYTFTTEEQPRITLIWTPDHAGVNTPSHTGNQARPVLPNPVMVNPLPDTTGITTTTTPAPDEKHFADYILILPMPDLPPIYVYLSKPPVEFLEVEPYDDFTSRSRQGEYHADHMPSRAAVELYLEREYPEFDSDQIKALSGKIAAIIVPVDVHRKISATYGGRNQSQKKHDSYDLRTAADKDFDIVIPALKEHGATDTQLKEARAKIHKINNKLGLYK